MEYLYRKTKSIIMSFVKKILRSPILFVLIDQSIFSGTNFILTLFLAQKLNIQNFGLFSSIVLITYLAMSLSNALLIQPFQVSIPKIQQQKEYYVSLFLGLVALLLLFIFIVKSLVLFFPNKNLDYNAAICFLIGYLFQDFFRKLFLGINKVNIALLIDILFIVIAGFGFYFFRTAFTISNVCWVLGCANLVSSVPGIIFLVKNYEKPKHWKTFLKDHTTQGKWLCNVAILQWCSSNFFVLVSGIYLGIEALSVLRLVQSFFGIINVMLQSVENYFLPKVARLFHDNKTKAKKYLIKMTLFGGLVFMVLLSAFFIFSDAIIVLLGGIKYQNYGFVVKLISVLYVFIFLSYPVRIAIRILVLNKSFFVGYLISFSTSLLTFHVLLKSSGLAGAVSGLIINQVLMILYWQYQLKKHQFILWK